MLRPGKIYLENEAGGLHVFAILSIGLFFLFFFEMNVFVKKYQEKIAKQSMLDICAVKLAVSREHLLENILTMNRVTEASRIIVYISRGLKFHPIGALASGISEAAALKINQTAALLQDTQLKLIAAKELAWRICGPTPYTKSVAACNVSPNANMIFTRDKALFADLKGDLSFKENREKVSEIICRSNDLITKINIHKNISKFTDRYEK